MLPTVAEQVHLYPGCAVSGCEGIAIILWTGEPTLAANQWATRMLLARRGRPGADVTVLQIITEDAGTPDSETRAYIQEVYKRELSDVRRMVSAPLGNSFRQSVVRTILRGMALFAGKASNLTVVATLDDAYAAVLAGRSQPRRAQLEAQVQAMLEASREGPRAPP